MYIVCRKCVIKNIFIWCSSNEPHKFTLNNDIICHRYQRVFNKKGGVGSAHELKAEKGYPYIPALIHRIIRKRLEDYLGMSQNVVLSLDDPRSISKVLASIPTPPPQQLVLGQKSKFVDPKKTLDHSWND